MLSISPVSNSYKSNYTKNQPVFSARIEDDYGFEKTNAAKKIAPLAFLGGSVISSIALMGNKEFKIGKLGGAAVFAIGGLISAAVGLGVGAIVDAVSNGRMQKDAYHFLQTKEVPPDTNKGKITGLIIGSGFGLLGLLGHKPIAAKALGFVTDLAICTISCGAYDYSVNKNRKEMAEQNNPIETEKNNIK